MPLDQNHFTRAFDLWETQFHQNPEQFMTAEEMAAADKATLAEERAIHMIACLRATEG